MEPEIQQAWVSGLRAGEQAAFRAVYDAFRPRVFGYLARMCGDAALAEDLLQETWLRLARSARDLAPDSRLAPWLFTVARNVFLSQRRKRTREATGLASLAAGGAAEGPGASSPFEDRAAVEMRDALEAGLLALPEEQREVMLLVGVERLTPAEAAVVLGLRPEALRKRLSRARARLSDWLAERAKTGDACDD